MTTIYADEILPGDVLLYDGYRHEIIRIDRRAGWAWPIAVDASGWAIALGHQPIDVQRAAACCTAFRAPEPDPRPPGPTGTIRWTSHQLEDHARTVGRLVLDS